MDSASPACLPGQASLYWLAGWRLELLVVNPPLSKTVSLSCSLALRTGRGYD